MKSPQPGSTTEGTRSLWKVPSLRALVVGALFVSASAFVVLNAERDGPAGVNNQNPAGKGQPAPVTPLWSSVDWVVAGQIAAIVVFFSTVIAVVLAWRRHPRHPFLLMVLASNTLIWWDPINNWMIGLVYNPRIWHFPESWPWVNISPIIEPLTSFVYAPYIMLPLLLSMPALRWLQRSRGPEAYVWRHPLISLGILTFLIGFIWDAAQEILLVKTQFLTYTHVVPFGSIFVGENYQFPLLMASGLITLTMIPAAVLLYRDDSGRTQAEKLAQRLKLHAKRPATATFLVMAVIINIAMICFSTSFWLVRVTGAASSVACPWPYVEAKVWDPHGLYEKAGSTGPFTAGAASTWLSGQPDGRPTSVTPDSDRCSATK